ncbi:MAG: GNAT family N-acetyltransferase [Clostridia bacterium]|nr:GNAT family N-acetyltransferase [Clostridia bacterium]
MEIRNMTINDYDEVYNLWINTPGMGLNNIDDSKKGIERYLKRNPATCFIAKRDNSIVGVILSRHDGRRGYIHHTAVAGSERRKGTGEALLNAALNALRDEGISKAALVAFSKNEIGNRFWEKNGFIVRDDLVYRDKELKEIVRMDT